MKPTRARWQISEFLETRLGLVVFDEDPVSGPTLHRLLDGSGINLQTARVPLPGPTDTADDLAAALTAAAASILPSDPPAVIAFACTTGAALMGQERLARAVSRPGHAIDPVTPLDSVIAALRRMEARRIAIVSPYAQDQSESVGAAIEKGAGVTVDTLAYFDAGDEAITGISHASIIAAARAVHASAREAGPLPDALFLSCTGLRATPLIEPLEVELGIPVLSSLQVMAWRAAQLLSQAIEGPGRLFALS